MTGLSRILELHELAVAEGKRHDRRRELFMRIAGDGGRHFIGIVGPRGAGKTVLLKQLAAENDDAVYVSVDTLPHGTDLFELVKRLAENYRFNRILLDEIHFLPEFTAALKQIYDFLQARIVFTSSVALAMEESAHDLARRVRLYTLDYFSFREYLEFRRGQELAILTVDELLENRVSPAHLRAGAHFEDYLQGGLLPFAMEEGEPLPLLEGVLRKIIERDIPLKLRLRVEEIPLLRKMIDFIGRSAVDGINYSTLAANVGITKYKAEQYVGAFETAFVLQRLFPCGTNVLREPKVLLVPPIRLMYRTRNEALGGLREDFFALAMRQAGVLVCYLKSPRGAKTPDFMIEHKGNRIVWEIGGRGKGRTQFKGITADRKIVLAQDVEPTADRLPLHLVGFLEV